MREKLVSLRAYACFKEGTVCGHTVEFCILRMVPLKHPRSILHLVYIYIYIYIYYIYVDWSYWFK